MAPRKQEEIRLEGTLDIRRAEKLKAEFSALLKGNSNIALNFEDVDDIDFAAIQLIYSFKKSLITGKRKLSLDGMNEKIKSKITLCDFQELLGLE
jgi:anti-anti-sigma factor